MSIDKSSNGGQAVVRPPSHPVPQLQKPFEESMLESVGDRNDQEVPLDAMTRRTMLLEGPTYQRIIAGRWKQKPEEKYHPLWKLVAQMAFGMHLFAQSMAISEEEVMRILQSHVDDIDGFLERTTEDFELAQSDIHERIRCLKLPLAHGEVFDRMLEDRSFRASILDGNEKIDHVIHRTKRAAKDALKDVQKGFDATNVLEKYLSKLSTTWQRNSPEHEAVLVAMLGNVDGWRRAFLELHLQGNKLSGSLKKLAEVVTEMQVRAAAVSRNMVAKSQHTKHISTQKAVYAHSQAGSIAHQKPLPTEPGRHRSTHPSSRSTQMSGISSRPGTGSKSIPGLTSHSSSGGHRSPRTPASKKVPKSETGSRSLSSAAKALDESRVVQASERMHNINGLRIQTDNEDPIELPADVPEDALRLAPVSVMNRLSMTLGLKPKDNSGHRISSVYYPRALGDLLKSPSMSQLLLTPQFSTAKSTPIHTFASPAVVAEGETDYYSSHERSPSIVMITPDDSSKKGSDSNKSSTPATRSSGRASKVGSAAGTRRSSIPNLAFTSHPVVMAMAAPPAELSAHLEHQEHLSTDSGKDSQPSSLGEPGPEMTERPAPSSDSMMPVETIPAAAEQNLAQTDSVNEGEKATSSPTEEVIIAVEEGIRNFIVAEQADTLPKESKASKNSAERLQTPFVAELEAIVPRPLIPSAQRSFGPAELEAPHHTFQLPPIPAEISKNLDKADSQTSRPKSEEVSKLPTELTVKPGMKPKDFGDLQTPEPIRPLQPKLAMSEEEIVPAPANASVGSKQVRNSGSKLRVDIVANIIETMSNTPPGSPLPARSSSSASSNSAQRWSHRSSRSLAPPAQAPPPPGPGGRPMVNPDFATAGEFEGERKQRKKGSSGGSKSSWKSFFGGSTVGERPASTSPETATAPDMFTATGKDILWFKGDGKRTIGIGIPSA